MNLKEKVFNGIDCCSEVLEEECHKCPYYNKEWENCNESDFCNDMTELIRAYDFAWSQFKETLEELIENNEGDVKEICTFLFNFMRIKEVDIENGFYI